MTINIEKITPNIASTMLATSTGNRVIKARMINILKKHLKDGTWQESLTDIMIDTDGHLVGGHHQLTAIVQTEISAMCLVKRGVPPSVKAMTNVCRPSSPDDAWLLSGHSPIKNSSRCWAALRFIFCCLNAIKEGRKTFDRNDHLKFTNEEFVSEMEKRVSSLSSKASLAKDLVMSICSYTPGMKIGASSPICGAMELLGEECRDFVSQLQSGTIIAGSPCEFFRQFIRNTKKDIGFVRGIGFILATYENNNGFKNGVKRRASYYADRLMMEANSKVVIDFIKYCQSK